MSSEKPQISTVVPSAAIPGGELQIRGAGLSVDGRLRVLLGDTVAPIVVGSSGLVVARVPENAGGVLTVNNGLETSPEWTCQIGVQIADGVHPVGNPAVDSFGNVYTTLSGQRGQKTPVSVYRVDTSGRMKPFVSDIMNATGVAFDRDGMLYISSRNDGIVYQCSPKGEMSVFVEGMGIATGLAFDADDNLYVGDRGGTIFKINRGRQIYVFATIESSIAAYHLAFSPAGDLFVTGPTTSSFDAVQRITPAGEVDVYYRGVGRPQGMAFDAEGRLYVSASIEGRRGIVRIADGKAELFASGPGIVGLSFAPGKKMIMATASSLYRLDAGVDGLPLPLGT
jgi:sugar lactone lactonase YvrE